MVIINLLQERRSRLDSLFFHGALVGQKQNLCIIGYGCIFFFIIIKCQILDQKKVASHNPSLIILSQNEGVRGSLCRSIWKKIRGEHTPGTRRETTPSTCTRSGASRPVNSELHDEWACPFEACTLTKEKSWQHMIHRSITVRAEGGMESNKVSRH